MSSTTTSGAINAAWLMPCSPVVAVVTSWPPAWRPRRSARSSDGSSSITRTFATLATVSSFVRNERQREDKPCSMIGCVLVPNPLAVRFDERFRDGESKTGAAPLVELCEPLEDRFTLIQCNARSFVRDGEFHVRVRARRLDSDDAVDGGSGDWRCRAD